MKTSSSPATLSKAFDVVCPAKHAALLAASGMIPASAAASKCWKDAIASVVTVDDLANAGVTIEEVAEAIEFYTATKATITSEKVVQTLFVRYVGEPVDAFLVLADGYRRGPAGDR
jgi:hypothetical protein